MIIILGVFLQTFANGLVMFAVARAIIGLGLSFEYTAAPMLVTELAHPTHRAQLSTFLNTLYNFGATIAAWICLGTLTIQSDWSWRSVSLIQIFPSLISVALTWWVPESPSKSICASTEAFGRPSLTRIGTGWLVSRGRDQEALDILRTHHCGGDENDELAAFELREIQHTLAFEKEHSSGSWLDLVRTKGNRHRTWICVTCAIAAQASGTTLTGCKYNYSSNRPRDIGAQTDLLLRLPRCCIAWRRHHKPSDSVYHQRLLDHVEYGICLLGRLCYRQVRS